MIYLFLIEQLLGAHTASIIIETPNNRGRSVSNPIMFLNLVYLYATADINQIAIATTVCMICEFICKICGYPINGQKRLKYIYLLGLEQCLHNQVPLHTRIPPGHSWEGTKAGRQAGRQAGRKIQKPVLVSTKACLLLYPPQNLMHCSCNLLQRAKLAFILHLEAKGVHDHGINRGHVQMQGGEP